MFQLLNYKHNNWNIITMSLNESIWNVYKNIETNQSISSKNTARNQVPKSIHYISSIKNKYKENSILLDLGCGKFNEKFSKEVLSLGFEYYGCDPFNKPKNENLENLKKCIDGNANVITLNNVLNTIKEDDVIYNILQQAKNIINKENGILIISIYEGVKTKKEKEEYKKGIKTDLKPIETRDGFQRRMKTESYLPYLENIFNYFKIVKHNGVKLIIASEKDLIS